MNSEYYQNKGPEEKRHVIEGVNWSWRRCGLCAVADIMEYEECDIRVAHDDIYCGVDPLIAVRGTGARLAIAKDQTGTHIPGEQKPRIRNLVICRKGCGQISFLSTEVYPLI